MGGRNCTSICIRRMDDAGRCNLFFFGVVFLNRSPGPSEVAHPRSKDAAGPRRGRRVPNSGGRPLDEELGCDQQQVPTQTERNRKRNRGWTSDSKAGLEAQKVARRVQAPLRFKSSLGRRCGFPSPLLTLVSKRCHF